MNKKIYLFLFLIFIFGYFLRVMFLPGKALTFGYDQARDAINALEIVHGHLKIFGPPASQPGLFHGVFYYYVLAPFYAIGHGNPIVAAYCVAALNAGVIFIIFFLTYLMTKKKATALIAAFLFAISFEATQYATWLSNPTLGIVTVPLMYFGLWNWVKEKKSWAPIITALGLGLSIQSEIFLVYHIVPLLFWLFIARKSITRKQIFVFGGVLLLTLSTMFLAQLKFGIGATLHAIIDLAQGQPQNLAYEKSLGDYLILYLNQVGRIFSFNLYPGNVGWGGGTVIGLIIYSFFADRKNVKKNIIDPKVFVSIWLLSHLTVVTVGGTSTPFLMVGIGPAVAILIALYLGELIKNYKIIFVVILLILIYGNLSVILRENKNASTLFSIQKDMVLSKQIKAIDYTYEKANNKPFSINTLTSPLWVNIVWTYLYKWYGQPKYGYVPTWHGRGQEGQVDTLKSDDNKWKLGFLVIEPQDGIPPQYLPLTIGQEDSYSKLVDEKQYGAIRVQERVFSR